MNRTLSSAKTPEMKPYDAATQQRVIRERLHALDMVNERFARTFRMSLFNLLRRSSDITVSNILYQGAGAYEKSVQGQLSLNLVSMKPLRGNMLVAFPSKMVFMVVDNLFGGDGEDDDKGEAREFSATEQRIIQRMTRQVMECYETAWSAVFPVELEFVRSETQPRFTNLTNSPTEMVITTIFTVEVGSFSTEFQIVIPWATIEPIRSQLNNTVHDRYNEDPMVWNRRMKGEIQGSGVELRTNFIYIDSNLRQLMALKKGDVLPIDLPETVTSSIDGVPVFVSEYGTSDDAKVLRVTELINHALLNHPVNERFVKTTANKAAKDI